MTEVNPLRLLAVSGVAEQTELSVPAVRRLIRSGAFPIVRIGEKSGGVRIRERDLLAWLDGAAVTA